MKLLLNREQQRFRRFRCYRQKCTYL